MLLELNSRSYLTYIFGVVICCLVAAVSIVAAPASTASVIPSAIIKTGGFGGDQEADGQPMPKDPPPNNNNPNPNDPTPGNPGNDEYPYEPPFSPPFGYYSDVQTIVLTTAQYGSSKVPTPLVNPLVTKCPASKGYAGGKFDLVTIKYIVGDTIKDREIRNPACINFVVKKTNAVCTVDVKATVTYDPVVANPKTPKKTVQNSSTSQWQKSAKKAADVKYCNKAISTGAYVSDKNMGQYRFVGVSRVQDVTVTEKINPINNKVTKTIAVGAIRQRTNKIFGQRTCLGWDDFISDSGKYTYTLNDCEDVKKFTKTPLCSPAKDGTVTVNGTADSNVSLFRDGDPNQITFGAVGPNLKGDVKITKVKINSSQIAREGTPTGKLFTLSTSKSSRNTMLKNNKIRVNDKKVTTYYARGMWASEENKPTVLVPSWTYDVDYEAKYATTTSKVSIDSDGKLVRKDVSSTSTSRGNGMLTCNGKTVKINFVRGITTN